MSLRTNSDLPLSLSLQEQSELAFYSTTTEDVTPFLGWVRGQAGRCSLLLDSSKVPSRAFWRDLFVSKLSCLQLVRPIDVEGPSFDIRGSSLQQEEESKIVTSRRGYYGDLHASSS